MFIAVTDIEDSVAPIGERAVSARRPVQTVEGCLSCGGRTINQVTDGSSNTILCIEDAGRAHPSAGTWGSLSSRPSPISEGPAWSGGSGGGRRMYAWADPDAGTNGLSGPSNSLGSKTAKINNYASPLGGPAECRWSNNNCGPNDEPFAFHTGGVNVVMADGSVRFLRDSLDALTLKFLAGSQDGRTVSVN